MGIYGLLARHGDEVGSLTPLHDDDLETEAEWRGKKGQFARVFREHYQLASGELKGWREWNGEKIARAKRDRVRKRESRSGVRAPSASASTDSPRPVGGAAHVQDKTRQDLTTTTGPAAPKQPPSGYPGFVAQAGDLWVRMVGAIEYGRVAADLKDPHRIHGPQAVIAAIQRFAEHRTATVKAGAEKPDSWPQFVRDLTDYIPASMRPRGAA